MKRFVFMITGAALAVTVLVAGAFAASTIVKKPVLFTAKYSGTAVTTQNDSAVAITASGKGLATLIGAGKLAGIGTGDSSVRPCPPFVGTGSMAGTFGKITFKVLPGTSGCTDADAQVFSISGKAKVVTATGKLAKATGTLKLTGTYDRSSGSFSIKFKGTLLK